MKSRFWAAASTIALLTAVGAYGSAASAAPFVTGDIFAAVNNGNVQHYNAAGTLIETLNTGQGGFTTGMAFDGAGNLLVTNFSAGNITKFSNTGVIVPPNPLASPGAGPESISFDTAGNFYVGRANGTPQKYNASGTLLQTLGTPGNSDWLDLAADQTTLFYNDEGGTIHRWNTATNSGLADFANNTLNGGSNSYALRILGNGDVLTAAGSQVLQYNAVGSFLGAYDITAEDTFFALNLDPNGTSFWSGSYGSGKLFKFNIGTFGNNTAIQTLNTGVGNSNLFGVAIAGEITAGGPGPGVPEPATWAMMLIGFGGLGAVVRRRRAQSVAAAG